MLGSKKTVEGVKSTFTKMISDLEEIQCREEITADVARTEMRRAEAEAVAAGAFKLGLGKLIAGE